MWKKNFVFILTAVLLIGCSGEEAKEASTREENSSVREQQPSAVSFRNVDMEVIDGIVILQGEAMATDTNVYYRLDHEGEPLNKEAKLSLKENASRWKKFTLEIDLPKQTLTAKEPPVLALYGKNDKDEPINTNYFPVDVENK
ncbi:MULTISPECIES: hypothetical protein [Clostridia]|uniref:hypothetical protein n=1 Tax=Clostridia TaxID=186801 RepID=UPI000EA01A7F|nr:MULTISPECIES: hypothetical protein [Clostridia]NBJ70950.1 hypothetical protein [Roseburia sp. 1XD42-34]RKI75590.1 hypothetical protein D7V87_16030 [Clostridium sp. 1xD42-85]